MKNKVAKDLSEITRSYEPLLRQLSEERCEVKPAPGKWSKKEELGHLIDSAQNNIRRVVSAQYEDTPNIFYEQEFWVKANAYNEVKWTDLITLWRLVNEQFARIVSGLSVEGLVNKCNTGKGAVEIRTLEYIILDYPKHMLHHLHHVLELEAVAYP